MEQLKRIMSGDFARNEARQYLLCMSGVFWGLILLAWLGYPAENRYSIMTHTFSFLGSYETKHNPHWWWLFTVAMIFWGGAGIPLSLYYRRRLHVVSARGAWVGAGLLILGFVNIGLVGVFPDVRTVVYNELRVTDIHEKTAVLSAVGFILGISGYGLLLLKDALGERRLAHRGMVAPYVFWVGVLTVASYFLIKWEFVYAEKRAAAQAAGVSIGSSWSEALNTRYSFPLWENILIYTLFIFLVWFGFTLSQAEPRT